MRTFLLGVFTLAYPVLIYFGLEHAEPRFLSLLLAGLAILRAFATREPIWLAATAGALILASVSLLSNQAQPLKLYPVLVSLVFLLVFGLSLRHPPTVIERLARLTEPQLSEHGIAYTRRVTQIWCVFFLVNASIALYTVLYGSNETWALYNGLLAYIAMGILFSVEWLIRQRIKAKEKNV